MNFLITNLPEYATGREMTQSPASKRVFSADSVGEAIVKFTAKMHAERPESSVVLDIERFDIKPEHIEKLKLLGVRFDRDAQPPDILVDGVTRTEG